MRFSVEEITSISESTGHRPEMLEKVVHLLHLLNSFNTHPFLKGKWALKGGTALNVFAFDLPRLSVDIDLNYIGALDRDSMEAERPKIEQAMQAVFSREGHTVKRIPDDHAGGKLSALMSRGQARDLYDCSQLFTLKELETEKLRHGFVLYGAMNRKDWRTINIDDIGINPGDINSQLIPTLGIETAELIGSPREYGESLIEDCRTGMSTLLPFSESEQNFLDLILDRGEIDGSILTSDPVLQERISLHPALLWKALNVKQHKGL